MSYTVPHGQPLMLPKGTRQEKDAGTWALYYNPYTNQSWLVYVVPAGLQVTALPGKYTHRVNLSGLAGYVAQRQATACCDSQ